MMNDKFVLTRRAAVLGGFAVGGCSTLPRLPDSASLNRYIPVVSPEDRRPLITIPGILGSRLRNGREGDFLWGGPNRLSLDPINPANANLLALPMGDGTEPFANLVDSVRTDGVLRRANALFFGARIEEQVYEGLVNSLNAGGYQFSRTEAEERARQGKNPGSLEFPYDWRRDIVESARDLDAFVKRKAKQVSKVRQEKFGKETNPDKMKFDFVAHSMGCLVLRYWLMYGDQDLPEDGSLPELTWAGAKRAACVVFIAPPNLGSIDALDTLTNGEQLGPLQPTYPPALVGTFPSLYQLLPRERHNRALGIPGYKDAPAPLFEVALWQKHRWGLMNPSQDKMLSVLMPGTTVEERSGIASRYLARALARAEQFHQAIDRPGTPSNTDLFLVVGTGLDTPAAAQVDASGKVAITHQEEGDGVVLRASALSDERQGGSNRRGRRRPISYRTVLLLPGEHVEITSNPVFADNLLHWLLDAPRMRNP